MKKTSFISLVLLVLFCSCSTSKLLKISPDKAIQTNVFDQQYSDENSSNVFQPSGKTGYKPNDLAIYDFYTESNIPNLCNEMDLMHTSEPKYAAEKNIYQMDTAVIVNEELQELDIANDSFKFGLSSLIALITSVLLLLSGALFLSVGLFITSFILGLFGLGKGITAKRILRKENNIYSNANKANWGITFSLIIFASIVFVFAYSLFLWTSGNGFSLSFSSLY